MARFEDTERADHAQLRFRLSGGEAHYEFPGEPVQPAPAIHVIGPSSEAFRTCVDGPVEVVGMGLQPAGWAELIRVDASSLLNRVVDARLLFPAAALDEAMARLRHAPERTRVAAAEEFVHAQLGQRGEDVTGFTHVVERWITDSNAPEVDALIERSGLSRRQLERRTKALYGVPPKMLARKYRALRAAVAIAEGMALADALGKGGFYDQSHLIRELKQFTGLTPRKLREQPTLLAQLTMTNRRALEGQVSTIISDT